jgi:hypothetical protein
MANRPVPSFAGPELTMSGAGLIEALHGRSD